MLPVSAMPTRASSDTTPAVAASLVAGSSLSQRHAYDIGETRVDLIAYGEGLEIARTARSRRRLGLLRGPTV